MRGITRLLARDLAAGLQRPRPCYANGQALAYLYGRANEAEALQAKSLTNDEARRIAVNIARLAELLGKGD
jgi:hypothetical protein